MAGKSEGGADAVEDISDLRECLLDAIGRAQVSIVFAFLAATSPGSGMSLLLPQAMKIQFAGRAFEFSSRDFEAMRDEFGFPVSVQDV